VWRRSACGDAVIIGCAFDRLEAELDVPVSLLKEHPRTEAPPAAERDARLGAISSPEETH